MNHLIHTVGEFLKVFNDSPLTSNAVSQINFALFFSLRGLVLLFLFLLFPLCIFLEGVFFKRSKLWGWLTIIFYFVACKIFFLRSLVTTWKPVIYLYPREDSEITVKLKYSGRLTVTYPPYDEKNNGWMVRASPDGTLNNLSDGCEYSYLFWEGVLDKPIYRMPNQGWIVTGSDLGNFLQRLLSDLGLKPHEYNELIVFWLPQLQDSPFVHLALAGKEYEESAELIISPPPDTILRVFLYFKKLKKFKSIEPQEVSKFERRGFSVVEWGGTILTRDEWYKSFY